MSIDEATTIVNEQYTALYFADFSTPFISRRRGALSSCLAILGVAAVLFFWASVGCARNVVIVGTITELMGTAQVRRAGTMSDVTVGISLQNHDIVTTAAGSKLTISLGDKGTLRLLPSSTVEFDRIVLGFQVTLLRGSLETHMIPPSPNIFFRTSNGTIQVRG
jgi:hypothetical protein